MFHSHEASFVYNRHGVWNGNWCGPQELFHLVAESVRELCTFLLAISSDIGLNKLMDFFGIQTLGALGWCWLLHSEHAVVEVLGGFGELGERGRLWLLKAFFF